MGLDEISIAFLAALTIGLALTPLARMVALKSGFMDRPAGRKKHMMSTPLLGGVAIYLAFTAVMLGGMFLLDEGKASMISLPWDSLCILVVVSGGLMTLVGLLDDIMNLKPGTKLLLHTLAVILAGIFFIVRGASLNVFLSERGMAWLEVPLTVIWLVGITNSFNLLDHADGLASGTAVVAGILFTVINVVSGNYHVAFVSAALAGAALGFFPYNSNPASIFMGDSGSNMLGFMLGMVAVLGVYTPEGSLREIAIFSPVLILALPILDTAFVLMFRWKAGKPLFGADRNHLAHRLMRLGLSHGQSVWVLLSVAVLMGIPALVLPTLNRYQAILVFAHAVGIVCLFSFFMHRAEASGKDER